MLASKKCCLILIPLVTDLPGHPDPDFKNTLFFTTFPLIDFLFQYLSITKVALRDHSSEKDFHACYIKNLYEFFYSLSQILIGNYLLQNLQLEPIKFGVGEYACPYCSKIFKSNSNRKDNCVMHMQKIHNSY